MTPTWRKFRRFLIHNVLHADDTPHRIAWGVAIGVFIAFTPTVGIQMFLAVAIAAALRANKVVCIPMVWITNPVTILPIYALCHRLGSGLWEPSSGGQVGTGHVISLMDQIRTLGVARVVELSFWKDVFFGLTMVGAELWIGCLIVGFIAGTISYFASRWAVTVYRQRRRERIELRASRRTARGFTKRVRVREPSL